MPESGSIEFKCHVCANVIRTAAANAGKRGTCNRCQTAIVVPNPAAGMTFDPETANQPVAAVGHVAQRPPEREPQRAPVDGQETVNLVFAIVALVVGVFAVLLFPAVGTFALVSGLIQMATLPVNNPTRRISTSAAILGFISVVIWIFASIAASTASYER